MAYVLIVLGGSAQVTSGQCERYHSGEVPGSPKPVSGTLLAGLSRCQTNNAKSLRPPYRQATATTARHVFNV
jgi:hypothetical protein